MNGRPAPVKATPQDGRAEAGVEELARELAQHGACERPLAIVLGSGLGGLAEELEDRREIPRAELAHLPPSSVKGHPSAIVLGKLAGLPVLVQSGRVHLYEGRSPFEVTRAVRAFARLGVRGVLLTNAAGGIVPEWASGTIMRLTDHLNLQGRSPLRVGEGGRAAPYDEELGACVDAAAREVGLLVPCGVYAGMLGPAYETPAEIRALRKLGAHAVGMSTVAEASAAQAAGMRVVALACIANPAAGIGADALRHEDVLATMRRAGGKLTRLLQQVAPLWSRALQGGTPH